jgi:hypothetical protein
MDIATNPGEDCHDLWQRTTCSPLLSILFFVTFSEQPTSSYGLKKFARPPKRGDAYLNPEMSFADSKSGLTAHPDAFPGNRHRPMCGSELPRIAAA